MDNKPVSAMTHRPFPGLSVEYGAAGFSRSAGQAETGEKDQTSQRELMSSGLKGYPKWFYVSLMATVLSLFISALLLVPTLLVLRLDWSFPWRLSADHRIAVAAIHSLASFIMLAGIGALWSIHMRSGWRRRKHWRSGLGLVVLMGVLLLTAIGIYYIGDDDLSTTYALIHVLVGLLASCLFVWHMIIGRRSRHRHGH